MCYWLSLYPLRELFNNHYKIFHLSYRQRKGLLECRFPMCEMATGCKSTSALLAAPCASRRAIDIACIAGRTSCNLFLLLVRNTLHERPLMPGTFDARDLPPTWLPQIPSWFSAIICVHWSPLTHTKIGWVNPCLNSSPSTRVYLTDFLFIFLPSSVIEIK